MTIEAKPLKIVIDARLREGVSGGILHGVIGLASGLSHLMDGDETYGFLCYPDSVDWLLPHMSEPCEILLTAGNVPKSPPLLEWLKRKLPSLRRAVTNIPLLAQRPVHIPLSDGSAERIGADLIHFTHQTGFLTSIPSIYQPWDLQHLHLPQFFTPREIYWRNRIFKVLCDRAKMVVAASTWGKHDLMVHYDLPNDKVRVVPMASVLSVDSEPNAADLSVVRSKYNLPHQFIFYPAQTWPHKNHQNLLEALAYLRHRYGLVVPLVCCGYQNDYYATIQQVIERLNLAEQVWFLGYVNFRDIQSLYRLATALVFPSKFEGWGLPITEAMTVGLPVATSKATCLPEQAGEAAIMFDPGSVKDIAEAIYQLWTDPNRRYTLSEKGKQRAGRFTWERTAKTFRAHYRRLCHRRLTDEDIRLLSTETL